MQSSAAEQSQSQSKSFEEASLANLNSIQSLHEESGIGVGTGLGLEVKGSYLTSRQRGLCDPKNVVIMVRHICDMVEQMRGRRPSSGSSFAAIGVDSLGAVMFVKFLSDSLGSIRIEPSKIYAPGVTIRSFAEGLITRLEKEGPDALLHLGTEGKRASFPFLPFLLPSNHPSIHPFFPHFPSLFLASSVCL